MVENIIPIAAIRARNRKRDKFETWSGNSFQYVKDNMNGTGIFMEKDPDFAVLGHKMENGML